MSTIYITAVRMSDGGNLHRHIAAVEWENRETGETGIWTTAQMVRWIKTQGNEARVDDKFQPGYVVVGVVEKAGTPPFIRTYRDSTKTDNLLELPPIKE